MLSSRLACSCLLAAACWLLSPLAAAQTPVKLTVSINPKKTDRFTLLGSAKGLSLDGGGDLTIALDRLSWSVPLSEFRSTARGKRLEFKGRKGFPGLSRVLIDVKSGKLTAEGGALILSGLPNPVPVSLAAGGVEGCGMLRLKTVSRRKKPPASKAPRLRVNPRAARQPRTLTSQGAAGACVFQGRPQAEPHGIPAGTTSAVRVRAAVRAGTVLEEASLYRASAAGAPSGSPLCTLSPLPDGSSYECGFTHAAGKTAENVQLVLAGRAGSSQVVSPGFSLEIYAPLSMEDAALASSGQRFAAQAVSEALAGSPNREQARVSALQRLRRRADIADAALTASGEGIIITFNSGIRGGILLDGRSGAASGRSSRRQEPALSPPLRAAETAINTSAVIWDPGYFQAEFSESGPIQELMGLSKTPQFSVTRIEGSAATVDSLSGLDAFGTVVLVTHGLPDHEGRVMFMAGGDTGPEALAAKAADLQAHNLMLASDVSLSAAGYFVLPNYIRNLPGSFRDSFIYAGFCYSAANDSLAQAFFDKGAGGYFGYSQSVNTSHARDTASQLFCSMLLERPTLGEAFAHLDPKIDPQTSAESRLLGSPALRYPGDADFQFDVALDPQTAHGFPNYPLSFKAEVGAQEDLPCFKYRWSTSGISGALETVGEGEQENRYTPYDPPGADDTVTVEVFTKIGDRKLGEAAAAVTYRCLRDISINLSPAEQTINVKETATITHTVTAPDGCDVHVSYSFLNDELRCGPQTHGENSMMMTAEDCRGGETLQVRASAAISAYDPDGSWHVFDTPYHADAVINVVNRCAACRTSPAGAPGAASCAQIETCCSDEDDNDLDGQTDCADSDCSSTDHCLGFQPISIEHVTHDWYGDPSYSAFVMALIEPRPEDVVNSTYYCVKIDNKGAPDEGWNSAPYEKNHEYRKRLSDPCRSYFNSAGQDGNALCGSWLGGKLSAMTLYQIGSFPANDPGNLVCRAPSPQICTTAGGLAHLNGLFGAWSFSARPETAERPCVPTYLYP